MREASVEFARLVARSHRVAVRADVLFDREVIRQGVAVVSGGVTYDRAASRIASASVLIAEPTLMPVSSNDILTPFGYELRLWRGVELPPARPEMLTDETGAPLEDEDGLILFESSASASTEELVPLGTFPIQRSRAGAIDRVSSLTLQDRSQLVSDARLEDVYRVAAGTNYADAIRDLIDDGVPGLEYLFPSITHTAPLLTFDAQADRWEVAQRMAQSTGHRLLFDGLGRVVMRPEPTFSDAPDARIADAANLVDAAVDMDRTDAYNKVIAAGRNADNNAEFTGTATDDDPASPTYYFGPFGRKPRFHYSEFYASSSQATAGAEAMLASQLGVARSVPFVMAPDPRLEVGDVVEMYNEALEVDELHIIDTLTIGLGASDPVTGTTRTRQVAA